MAAQTTFELFGEARTEIIKPLSPGEATTLLAGGIVNPFGPTLNALVAAGKWQHGGNVAILHVMLNPFRQFVREVGCANVGDTLDLPIGLRRFFALPFGSCPTMLLPSALTDERAALDTYSAFLASFQDGLSRLEGVRRFPGDPWSRVQTEVDQAMSSAVEAMKQAHIGPAPESSADRPLTMAEARELAGHLLDPANLKLEIQAFLFAWDGSVKFHGDGPMAEQAMSIDDFGGIFDALAQSCALPPFGS